MRPCLHVHLFIKELSKLIRWTLPTNGVAIESECL